MRWSQVLIPTQKQSPADSPSPGHALLSRAGLIHLSHASDQATFLPLGLRTLNNLANLVRALLDDLGFQEILVDPNLGESFPIALTASTIRSYKQLPHHLFQVIQSPTAALSTFNFHPNEINREKSSDQFLKAISDLVNKLNIHTIAAQTATGPALVTLSDSGKTSLLVTETGHYAATPDAAEIAARHCNFAGEPAGPLEKISTPNLTTVAEVCAFLKTTPRHILKTLVFVAQSPIAIRWLVAVVRGDHQVNLRKLSQAAQAMGVTSLRLAGSEEARGKWTMGFVGPDAAMKLPDAVLIVDPDAAHGEIAWFAGGNEPDVHVRNFNWFRECGDRLADPVKVTVADVRNAVEGDLSPTESVPLRMKNASLLFAQNALPVQTELAYDDVDGQHRPLALSTTRLDLFQLLLATAESNHDQHGLLWPPGLAPCSVVITAIQNEGAVYDAAESLYTRLTFDGIDTILDDRDLRAGPKFADADLIGFPIRITVGPRTVERGHAEIKLRSSPQSESVPLANVPARVAQMLMDQ